MNRAHFLTALICALPAWLVPWRVPAKTGFAGLKKVFTDVKVEHGRMMSIDPAFKNGDDAFVVTWVMPPVHDERREPYILRVEKLT